MQPKVIHYFDYKSPYAYLSQEKTSLLTSELGIEVDFRPYTLDIPSYLGAAELDAEGRDVLGTRTKHQWRRVLYSYRDCRREATKRGLVLRGPQRIYDSSVAHIGMLYAQEQGDFRPYHDQAFQRFFHRAFDPGSILAVEKLLEETGIDPDGFRDYLKGQGRGLHDQMRDEAEMAGVFGVPSYLVNDELYWGGERLEQVREHILSLTNH